MAATIMPRGARPSRASPHVGPCGPDGTCGVHDAFYRAQEAVFTTLADVSLDQVTR